MMASTRSIWIKPPKVYEETIPSNQRTNSMMAIVHSIGMQLSAHHELEKNRGNAVGLAFIPQ